jgi:hypothetical protein
MMEIEKGAKKKFSICKILDLDRQGYYGILGNFYSIIDDDCYNFLYTG